MLTGRQPQLFHGQVLTAGFEPETSGGSHFVECHFNICISTEHVAALSKLHWSFQLLVGACKHRVTALLLFFFSIVGVVFMRATPSLPYRRKPASADANRWRGCGTD
jgi:hypothetical protein